MANRKKTEYVRTRVLLKDGEHFRKFLWIKSDSKQSLMIGFYVDGKVHDAGDIEITPNTNLKIEIKDDNVPYNFLPQKINFHPDGNITIKSINEEYLSKYNKKCKKSFSFEERERLGISQIVTICPMEPFKYPKITKKKIEEDTPNNFSNLAIMSDEPFILDLYYLTKGTPIDEIPRISYFEERLLMQGSPSTPFNIGAVIRRGDNINWQKYQLIGYIWIEKNSTD